MGTLTILRHEYDGETAGTGASIPLQRADAVQPIKSRPDAVRSRADADRNESAGVYLFIYRVRHRFDAYAWVDNIRYCTVFALGKRFAEAEQIAINCVHQHGWRILKTDTATEFALDRFTDAGADSAHLANLRDFGVSFKLHH